MKDIKTLKTGFISGTFLAISLALAGCGGGGSDTAQTPTPEPTPTPAPTPAPEPTPERDWWDVDAPDYSSNDQRPVITLNGDSAMQLPVGADFEDAGASAMDPQDGDLTANIQVRGSVDTSTQGDYALVYSVVDADENVAVEQTRIVRVVGDEATRFTLRPLGDFQVNMGYVEHLPTDYGQDTDAKYPLIIYHHGNGANAEFWNNADFDPLLLVVANLGIPTIIEVGRWDEELPFVVLMPQAGVIEGSSVADRVDVFVQHALLNYNVDPSRVYMMGWSQGGFVSLEYASHYPEKLAAVVSVSSGLPFQGDPPENFCNLEQLPIWLFHGDNDMVVPHDLSLFTHDAIVDNCQPEILPRLTIFNSQTHFVHHAVYDDGAMHNGRLEVSNDPNYDLFDISLYEWALQYTNNR